jgi:hypothetical protein
MLICGLHIPPHIAKQIFGIGIRNNLSHKPANLNVLVKLIILCVMYFLATRGDIRVIIRPNTFVILYSVIIIYFVLSVHFVCKYSDPVFFSSVRVRT